MHILLAALGAIVTILILVNRLSSNGIDIGWLNPFAWKRRRDWANKYHANPIYSLDSPMHVTALLIVALVKSEGEMSAEQKQEILKQFNEVFHLDEKASASLLGSSIFLLNGDVSSVQDIQKLMAPSKKSFTAEQVTSAVSMLRHIANYEGPPNSFQNEIIDSFSKYFGPTAGGLNEWS